MLAGQKNASEIRKFLRRKKSRWVSAQQAGTLGNRKLVQILPEECLSGLGWQGRCDSSGIFVQRCGKKSRLTFWLYRKNAMLGFPQTRCSRTEKKGARTACTSGILLIESRH